MRLSGSSALAVMLFGISAITMGLVRKVALTLMALFLVMHAIIAARFRKRLFSSKELEAAALAIPVVVAIDVFFKCVK